MNQVTIIKPNQPPSGYQSERPIQLVYPLQAGLENPRGGIMPIAANTTININCSPTGNVIVNQF